MTYISNSKHFTVEEIQQILEALDFTLTAKRTSEGWQPQAAVLSKHCRFSDLDDIALDELLFNFYEVTGHFLNRELLRVTVTGICIRNAIFDEEDAAAEAARVA